MTDDGFGKDKHPDDSRSGYDDAELAPEQPDPDSGQRQDDEPTQELSQSGETTQQFSTNPGDSHYQYGNQQYPQQNDSQNVQYSQDWNQYPQDWNQYPQSSDAWGSPDSAGWGQPTSQYEGWTGQYPQQGWDGQPPPRTTQTITSTAPANVGLAGMTLMERFPCNAGIRA